MCIRDSMKAVQSSLEIYRILVDKDGILPEAKPASDEIYWVKKPTEEQFYFTCNEFWWCLDNVAKGLWREELPYVMDMIHLYIRPMLTRILEWKIGRDNNFSVSVGKSAKYMKRYLPEETYKRYLLTYSQAETEAVWDAVFIMCDLFRQTEEELAEKMNFHFDAAEADNCRAYLEHVRKLPADAREIYE